MTETGTILLEKKTANQMIDEILKLDETDPIRKLQLYFKDGPYLGKRFVDYMNNAELVRQY